MTDVKQLQFEVTIDAPVERVWDTMLEPESYKRWTSAFTEGSYYEGSWDEGSRIRFLAPSGDGMVSEIAENRRHEFISIRHLGMIKDGEEDTDSDAVREWAPAYENYTFETVPGGTRVIVAQEMAAEYETMMAGTWSKAFAVLKTLCEG